MSEKTKKLILLIVLCTFTISILIIALKLNNIRNMESLTKSEISEYLTEINYEEISNYIVEQSSITIYVSNSSQENILDFENKFKQVIKRYNLENEVIYININDKIIVDPVYQNAPELVIYKDGEITDIIDCTTLKNSKDIIKALTERGIIND